MFHRPCPKCDEVMYTLGRKYKCPHCLFTMEKYHEDDFD